MPVSTRTRRLPLGSLSGDREAPSPNNHRTVTVDLAQAVAHSIRTCNPSATATETAHAEDSSPFNLSIASIPSCRSVRAGPGLDDGVDCPFGAGPITALRSCLSMAKSHYLRRARIGGTDVCSLDQIVRSSLKRFLTPGLGGIADLSDAP